MSKNQDDNVVKSIEELQKEIAYANSNAEQWAAQAATNRKILRQTQFKETITKLVLLLEAASTEYQRKALRRLLYVGFCFSIFHYSLFFAT